MAQSFVIAAAVKLCAENDGAGNTAKDGQVENEDKLVGDGHAGHLQRAHLTDHDIIQQVHQLRDAVLDHHRQGDG